MPFAPPRKHIALAVDGGGIKGLIVARALAALEKELGGKPLIEHPSIQILTGTSTGSLITAGIALGMTAQEIAESYIEAAEVVFPPLFPKWIPPNLQGILKILRGLIRPSLYSGEGQKRFLRDLVGKKTGNPDLTLGELQKRLRPDQALIITVVDINERRTHFLKSYEEHDADWKLWEAVQATASAPSFLPVLHRQGRYYTDGGAGSYGNPGYIGAHEAVNWQGYDPKDVTVFSFGTGWVNDVNFEKAHRAPNVWNLISWGLNFPLIAIGDAARSQSLDLIQDFIMGRQEGMDFRRFQVELETDIGLDDTAGNGLIYMNQLGDKLGQRILNNQHALGNEPGYDPEGLRRALDRYMRSKSEGADQGDN
jgi:predicted acylesterase/phospholipase RssA